MMVSVVMTTYNGEAYVLEQMKSLSAQTRRADEVIIRDDCSTDNTASIIREFIDKNALSHWKFSVNQENVGYRRNFAQGLAEATGEILFLCDQDDVWHADKIERLCAVFETHDEAMAVNSSFRIIDAMGKPNDSLHILQEQPDRSNYSLVPMVLEQNELAKIRSLHSRLPNILIRSNISPGCTMAIRAAVRDRYLQGTKFELPHDWEMNIIADAVDGMYFLNAELIDYRIHGANAIGLQLTDGLEKEPFMTRRRKRHEVVFLAIMATLHYIENDPTRHMLYDYAVLRDQALQRHSLTALLKLYGQHFGFCKGMLTLRGMLGDVYGVVTKK